MPNSDLLEKKLNYNFNKRLESRFKDEKLNYYRSFYYTQLETTVIKIALDRAVLEYADSFKTYFNIEQKLNNNDYIIDLSDALFLDSTFLGAIIYSLKMANSRGADLSIILDSDKIKILSTHTSLNKILTIYSSLNEAIEKKNSQ